MYEYRALHLFLNSMCYINPRVTYFTDLLYNHYKDDKDDNCKNNTAHYEQKSTDCRNSPQDLIH